MPSTSRAAGSVKPLTQPDLSMPADTSVSAFSPQTAAAPQATQPPPITTTVASPSANKDVEAVAMDPAALWAALDLPAPESMPSQHTARRVILLGRPLSGKRTVCRRLCFAAEAQYAAPDDEEDRIGTTADNGRQPLYHPPSSDEDDTDLFPNQNLGGWNMPGAFSAAGALQERTAVGPHNHSSPVSHGSGVCFDYVVQRVPTRIARSGGEGNDPASAARRAGGGGGAVRRTTEFFCCDSAGALSMALPSVDDVETAVVLIVVDVSDVATIRQQLDFCYSALNAYVATLLQNEAPENDEVRRLQLAAALQDYWFAEEHKMRTTRTNLASSVGSPRDGKSDVFFKDPMANLDKVNSSAFRIPSSAGTVCTMRTIIVCTKAEILERASRAVGVLDSAGGGSGDSNEALFTRLGVSAELAAVLRRSRLSLMAFIAQMIRQYALYRRAAVASISQRVNMTTAGADGEYAGSALVNPFYKGLWSYISYLLYDGKEANSSPSSDVLRICSARMHPHALLPCGLDALGLLNYFITSDPTQFAGLFNGATDETADAAIHTTPESVFTPDGVFPLHQKYIQLVQEDLSASWGAHADATASNAEEMGMIWDSL